MRRSASHAVLDALRPLCALRATCWFCESVRFGLDSSHLFAPRRLTCAPSMGAILEVKVLS
ncbi:hypothetical protein C6380_24090 [Pseudomonas syringae pv. actinidiae]|nr:hypothetical protein C6380_24090 [Pseudomonas syringae pv. actinidiae]